MHFTEKCARLGQENNFCTSIALDFNQLVCGRPGLNIPWVVILCVCLCICYHASCYIATLLISSSNSSNNWSHACRLICDYAHVQSSWKAHYSTSSRSFLFIKELFLNIWPMQAHVWFKLEFGISNIYLTGLPPTIVKNLWSTKFIPCHLL